MEKRGWHLASEDLRRELVLIRSLLDAIIGSRRKPTTGDNLALWKHWAVDNGSNRFPDYDMISFHSNAEESRSSNGQRLFCDWMNLELDELDNRGLNEDEDMFR